MKVSPHSLGKHSVSVKIGSSIFFVMMLGYTWGWVNMDEHPNKNKFDHSWAPGYQGIGPQPQSDRNLSL